MESRTRLLIPAVADATESNGLEANSSSSPDAVQPDVVGERRSSLTPTSIDDIPSFRGRTSLSPSPSNRGTLTRTASLVSPNFIGRRSSLSPRLIDEIPSFRGESQTSLTPSSGGERGPTRSASLVRERRGSLTPSFVSPSFHRERRKSLTLGLRGDRSFRHETASITPSITPSFRALERTKSNPDRHDQSDRSLAAALATEPFEPFTEGFSRAFKSIASEVVKEGPESTIGATELRNLLHSFQLYPSDDDLNELLQTLMGVGKKTKVDQGQGVTEERFFEMLRTSINTAGIRLDDFENTFQMIDIDGNGRLGAEELQTALAAMNEKVPEQALSSLLRGIGVSTRSTVTETELFRYINCHILQDADGTCIGREARSFEADRTETYS